MANKAQSSPAKAAPLHEHSAAAPRRRGRGWLIALGVILVIFAVLHWGGGGIAKHLVNRRLAAMDGYTGAVGAVKLALWRGGVDVEDFVLRERDKPNEPPLVQVRHASLSSALRPLLRGKLGGEGVVEDAQFIFAKHHAFAGPKDAAEKAAAEAEEKAAI